METETTTDNELIAEFMDLTPLGNERGWITKKGATSPGELEYHTSWDWLKPVVEKIAEYRLAYPEQANKVCNLKIVIGITPLYQAVIEFIKWYNNQKET